MRTEIYVLKALFSVPRDVKVSKPEAIFCLLKSRLYAVIFLPPWTYEDCD